MLCGRLCHVAHAGTTFPLLRTQSVLWSRNIIGARRGGRAAGPVPDTCRPEDARGGAAAMIDVCQEPPPRKGITPYRSSSHRPLTQSAARGHRMSDPETHEPRSEGSIMLCSSPPEIALSREDACPRSTQHNCPQSSIGVMLLTT
jgi:hypothetical protein